MRGHTSWSELVKASLLCAVVAGIAGTVAWAVVSQFWPGKSQRPPVDVIAHGGSILEYVGHLAMTVALTSLTGVLVGGMASVFAVPVAVLLMLPSYLGLRRFDLANRTSLAVVGAFAGTLSFWCGVTNSDLILFSRYEGWEKLIVAALIGGVGGIAGALMFAKSIRLAR